MQWLGFITTLAPLALLVVLPFVVLQQRRVVYPFADLVRRMEAKDPELFAVVAPMGILEGRAKWRETYPDDLAGEEVSESVIYQRI